MTKRVLILLAPFVFLLSSCNQSIDVVDGHIPAAFLESAKKWEGTYHGMLNGADIDVNIRLDGDRAIVSSTHDLTGDDCRSSVGNLKKISYKKGSTNAAELDFAFDAGECGWKVSGHDVTIWGEMNEDGSVRSIQYSIFLGFQSTYICSGGTPVLMPPPVSGGSPVPHDPCHWEQKQTYLNSDNLGRGAI